MTAALAKAPAGPARVPYVYILAASHSGSTLLALLLNAHPDVATVGEVVSGSVRDVERYRCSCRALLRGCPFWSRVSASVSARHPSFDLASFGIDFELRRPAWAARLSRLEHRGPALEALRDLALRCSPRWRARIRDAGEGCAALAASVLELTGARVFVDSSKLAHRLKHVRRVPGLDVKVVHLVRDGRAVALTYMDPDRLADARDPALRRGGSGEGPPPAGLPMARAADEWRRCLVCAENALATLEPGSWTRVRYEELCRDPEGVRGQVLRFLGLDPGRAARDFRAAEHHVVGNGMRLDEGGEVRLDERWRSLLTAEDLRTFDAVAGRLNRRYGYT
jgi:hypothetical protein